MKGHPRAFWARLVDEVERGGAMAAVARRRYHGVFAARSSWRPLVTPKPPDGVVRRKKKLKTCRDDQAHKRPSARVRRAGGEPAELTVS
jgi:hypothetical protein